MLFAIRFCFPSHGDTEWRCPATSWLSLYPTHSCINVPARGVGEDDVRATMGKREALGSGKKHSKFYGTEARRLFFFCCYRQRADRRMCRATSYAGELMNFNFFPTSSARWVSDKKWFIISRDGKPKAVVPSHPASHARDNAIHKAVPHDKPPTRSIHPYDYDWIHF